MTAPLIIVGLFCITASAQNPNARELARQLADDSARATAVARIVASGSKTVPLLLSLSKKPPAQVNPYALSIGLADAFGQLKTKEAIPFLIKNISLQRGLATPNTSMKTAEVIRQRMPAIAALIQIGPSQR